MSFSLMIKTLLLALSIVIIWSSPELRGKTADVLRITATWLEPQGNAKRPPKNFQIPNPFYRESGNEQ